jgi:hypothetical protein
MPKDSMNRWVAVAGFAVLAVVLVLEGAAISLALVNRDAIETRSDRPQPMMHFLFDRIAAGGNGSVATLVRPGPSRL